MSELSGWPWLQDGHMGGSHGGWATSLNGGGGLRLLKEMPFYWTWEPQGPCCLNTRRKEWGLGPAVQVRCPGLSGKACSGHRLFCSLATPQGAHGLRSRWPGPMPDLMLFPVLAKEAASPVRKGLSHRAPVSPPPLSEQSQGQPRAGAPTGRPGHRGEVMQWERTQPLSLTDLGSVANLQRDLGQLTSCLPGPTAS